jgi:hypothetical protein
MRAYDRHLRKIPMQAFHVSEPRVLDIEDYGFRMVLSQPVAQLFTSVDELNSEVRTQSAGQ